MNRELKEKVINKYQSDTKIIENTRTCITMILAVFVSIIFTIIFMELTAIKDPILFSIFILVEILPFSIGVDILDQNFFISMYLIKQISFLKKHIIMDLNDYQKDFRKYDDVYITRKWDLQCIDAKEYSAISINENISFCYEIVTTHNILYINEEQYIVLKKVLEEYKKKYVHNPFLLLTKEQYYELCNNENSNKEICYA